MKAEMRKISKERVEGKVAAGLKEAAEGGALKKKSNCAAVISSL